MSWRTVASTLIAALHLPSAAWACFGICVTDLVDDADTGNGTCTLREAIRAANLNVAVDACRAGRSTQRDRVVLRAGTHVVDLANGTGENNALNGDLDIDSDMEIVGVAADLTIVDGQSATSAERVFHVLDGADDVVFRGLTIRGGSEVGANGIGGNLLNEEISMGGSVLLVDVVVEDGRAARGGGIFNFGPLRLVRVEVANNHTTVDAMNAMNDGGGIASMGPLVIEDSHVHDNTADDDGGGVWAGFGSLDLVRTQLRANTAGVRGGALLAGAPQWNVEYAEFDGNQAFRGGGAYTTSAGEILRSAFVANVADEGGGLYDIGASFARFSTFHGNSATLGGGVYSDSSQTLLDSDTIAANTGGGVYNEQGVFFENTLIAANTGGNCTGNAAASGAFNLEDTDTCGFVHDPVNDSPNFPNTNPMLGALSDNGGPTPTRALLPGSPAIDAVTSEIRLNCEQMLDQRGHARGRPRNAQGFFLCDIGAFEHTTPFVVTTGVDAVDADPNDDLCLSVSDGCTLRAAVQQANAIVGFNEVELGARTHTLSIAGTGEDLGATGDLDITRPLRIRGAGSAASVIDANGLDRAFDVLTTTPLGNEPPRHTLEDLAVENGLAPAGEVGGGIRAERPLRLERVVLRANDALDSGIVGSAVFARIPGAFFDRTEDRFELVESTVELHTGATPLFANDAWIDRSSIVDNTPTRGSEFSALRMNNSTMSGNTSGGWTVFAQQALVENSTIVENETDAAPSTFFLLELSVFSNSVISENLVNGAFGSNCSASAGDVESLGHNLTDSDGSDCALTHPTDIVLVGSGLAALGDNGGPTPTHRPLAGSPLLDAGDDARCPAVDQRGYARPADGDNSGTAECDIGAVERNGTPPNPVPLPGWALGALATGLLAFARERLRRAARAPSDD